MSESTPTMPPEIAKAIVAVMSEVKKLGKEGTNTFQRYKFTSVDQFYEALGPLMASHGIFDVAIERSCVVETRETVTDRGEVKKGAWLIADYDFWLYHESGSSYGPIPRHIQVQASGPQSYASAQSFAEKYFLRNLLKVPTGDVDEIDQSDKQGLPEGRMVGKKISDTQVSMIRVALDTLTDKTVEGSMLTHLGKTYPEVKGLRDIPAGEVDAVMRALAVKMDKQAKEESSKLESVQ
jgi:ERF superfamily protein